MGTAKDLRHPVGSTHFFKAQLRVGTDTAAQRISQSLICPQTTRYWSVPYPALRAARTKVVLQAEVQTYAKASGAATTSFGTATATYAELRSTVSLRTRKRRKGWHFGLRKQRLSGQIGQHSDMTKQRIDLIGNALARVFGTAFRRISMVQRVAFDAAPVHATVDINGIKIQPRPCMELNFPLRGQSAERHQLPQHNRHFSLRAHSSQCAQSSSTQAERKLLAPPEITIHAQSLSCADRKNSLAGQGHGSLSDIKVSYRLQRSADVAGGGTNAGKSACQ